MQFYTVIVAALVAFQSASAQSPATATASAASSASCAAPTATTTHVRQVIVCRRIACPSPDRPCSEGERDRRPDRTPSPVGAVTPGSPGACTAVVNAIYVPDCYNCPTCIPQP